MIIWKKTQIKKLKNRLFLKIYSFLSIRFKLKYFIQTNELYLLEKIKTNETTKLSRTPIQISLIARWRIKKNTHNDKILIVQLLKTGTSLDSLLYDKAPELEALFKSELLTRKKYLTYIEFQFFQKKSKQDFFYLNDKITKTKGYISINKYTQWNYKTNAHALISGNSGSGKSYLLFSLIKKIMNETDNKNIYVCDGKFDELQDFAIKIGLKNVAKNEGEIIKMVNKISKLMDLSYHYKKRLKPIFIIIDEYAALQLVLEKKDYQILNKNLKNIILKGRKIGINVIIAVQRAHSDTIDLAIRDNLALKIGLGNLSPENFKMIFGISKNENEIKYFDNVGQGYCSLNGGEPFRFNTPIIKDQP